MRTKTKTRKTKVEVKPKTKAEVKTKVEVKIKNMPKPKAKPAATRLKKVSALPPVDEAVTAKEYTQLEAAFDHLNRELFGGRLPHVLITYQRRANSKGYFSDGRIAGRISKFTKAEIALNIDCFIGQSDEQIVSVLGHEMAHLQQYRFGAPSSRGYHNAEWARMMKAIGLYPSSTGAVGGRETGSRVSHYILPDGAFAQSFKRLAATGWKLTCRVRLTLSGRRKAPRARPSSPARHVGRMRGASPISPSPVSIAATSTCSPSLSRRHQMVRTIQELPA